MGRQEDRPGAAACSGELCNVAQDGAAADAEGGGELVVGRRPALSRRLAQQAPQSMPAQRGPARLLEHVRISLAGVHAPAHRHPLGGCGGAAERRIDTGQLYLQGAAGP
jgi:hypothetical protein